MIKFIVKYVLLILKLFVLLFLCVLFVRFFIFEFGQVNGRSMEDYFVDEEIFVVDKFSLLFRSPKRGDVVQVRDVNNRLSVKRVIGLPGEIINIQSNKVYIIKDGVKDELDEVYLGELEVTRSESGKAVFYEVLPNDYYFLMGDSRSESVDSRFYGSIDRVFIIGLVWPLR